MSKDLSAEFFFTYIKMSKDLSAKYDQDNKEKLQNKKIVMKGIKVFPKKEKGKSGNMVENTIKVSLKMKNKSWLKIEKKYYKIRKSASL